MSKLERVCYIFTIILLGAGLAACADAPPKNFKTRKFAWAKPDAPCLFYRKSGETVRVCPEEVGYPPAPMVIDTGGSGMGGYTDELGYQNLLKKDCGYWKK